MTKVLPVYVRIKKQVTFSRLIKLSILLFVRSHSAKHNAQGVIIGSVNTCVAARKSHRQVNTH